MNTADKASTGGGWVWVEDKIAFDQAQLRKREGNTPLVDTAQNREIDDIEQRLLKGETVKIAIGELSYELYYMRGLNVFGYGYGGDWQNYETFAQMREGLFLTLIKEQGRWVL